jgi:hypothetical protein
MSFDLAVWYEPVPVTDTQAAATYELLCRGEDAGLTNHSNLSTFFADLISEFGQWAWSEKPEVEDNGLLLSLSQATADEVAPKIVYLAERHGLVSYDPHAHQVQLPRPLGIPMLQLSGDGLPTVIDPSTEDLTRAVAGLRDKHVHLTLQRFPQQYVQAAQRFRAGAPSGLVTVEFRNGAPDQHFQLNTKDIAVVEEVFLGFAGDAEEWKRDYAWRIWP